jgi:nucleotide-binding universal stress UspA family protein
MRTADVVVGMDGSAASWDALYWAVVEAGRRQISLHLVSVDEAPESPASGGEFRQAAPDGRSLAMRASKMLTEARRLEPAIRITGEVADGAVCQRLCESAMRSQLLVVGGGDTDGSRPLGRVSGQVVARASAPVVVVRGLPCERKDPILAALDGSAGSEAVLTIAFEEARLRHSPLLAVHSYGPPAGLRSECDEPVPRRLSHALASSWLDAAMAPWRDKYPDVDVDVDTSRAGIVDMLTGLSRNAQLVVVGAHGGAPEAHLGSGLRRLLDRSRCPVLVGR